MTRNELTEDRVRLIIYKENGLQDQEIERLYVKQSDFDKFFHALINANVYFKGLKWVVGFILFTFVSGSVLVVYNFIISRLSA